MTSILRAAGNGPAPGPRPALISTRNLSVVYGRGGPHRLRRGIDHLDLDISRGEVLGLAGESGSGKSTLARALLGLVPIRSGQVLFDGIDSAALSAAQRRDMRRRVQIIFQDPSSALSPLRTVAQTLQEPLRLFSLCRRTDEHATMVQALAEVGLPAQALARYPQQFSSGQRQRIAIARALICKPDLLIADEAVAALDVSVQARILELLHAQHEQRGVAMLFISHDLAVIRQLASRIGVMYRGRLVEQAPARQLFGNATHPYTQALLAALPGAGQRSAAPAGSGISRVMAGAGCAYRPMCPRAMDICAARVPPRHTVPGCRSHQVECHLLDNQEPGHD